MTQPAMRSPRGFAGALVLLLGIPLALLAASAITNGAEIVLHFALGASLLLIASATFDFATPRWLSAVAGLAMAGLAVIFLLQGVSNLWPSEALRHIAFDLLGQRLERALGYVFPVWCACVLWTDSRGWTRALGALALVVVIASEAYGFTLVQRGGEAPGVFKLLYLPLFVWLLLESLKRRT